MIYEELIPVLKRLGSQGIELADKLALQAIPKSMEDAAIRNRLLLKDLGSGKTFATKRLKKIGRTVGATGLGAAGAGAGGLYALLSDDEDEEY